MFGNEEDFCASLGFPVEGVDENLSEFDTRRFIHMMASSCSAHLNLVAVSTTLRAVRSESPTIGARSAGLTRLHKSVAKPGLEILDRVGGGDSFASGLIYGLLAGFDAQKALEYGAAHGALAMTTPGDVSMATRAEVEALVRGSGALVQR